MVGHAPDTLPAAGLTLSAGGSDFRDSDGGRDRRNFTVQVKDAANVTADAEGLYRSEVERRAKALSITSTPTDHVVCRRRRLARRIHRPWLLPEGRAAIHGTLASGALPAGLTLSASGTIAGTPTAAGPANFTVQVKDSSTTTATKALTITVNAATS